MKRREEAITLINRVLNKESFLTYKEIAKITGYHEKYLLALKNQVKSGDISLHSNTRRNTANSVSDEEKKYIIDLYKRSNTSLRKFSKFYAKRSYSCIRKILKEAKII